ncbi:hypothetical protein BDQ12DRAFT_738311 [Crucibulum laeve]|uniref:Uncharacterized protein n=1 Tax=Crucibulum laeve TaxID=68775 RepID=A0A5C3LQI8_9AGAR|nr:hypothetical protein BDQ12DRAFT_738311 [Crucibulum laeve]
MFTISTFSSWISLTWLTICFTGARFAQWLLRQNHYSSYQSIDTSSALNHIQTPLPPSPSTAAPRVKDTTPHIHSLPVELLTEIFSYVVHDDSPRDSKTYTPPSQLSASENSLVDPIFLGQVCGRWRHVTLSMSSLWSTIFVKCAQWYHVPQLKLWLERSKNAPLSIHVVQDETDIDSAAVEAILRLFHGQSSRWKDVRLDLANNVTGSLPPLSPGDIQNLESFRLQLRRWPEEQAQEFCRVLYSSPTLRSASWEGCFKSGFPNDIPWQQLRDISLSGVSDLDELFSILEKTSEVEVLTLGSLKSLAPHYRAAPVLIPLLHTLTNKALTATTLFKYLTLPSLKSLILPCGFRCLRKSEALGWDALRELIERSDCRLEALNITELSVDEDILLANLAQPHFASIRELTLAFPVSNRTIMGLTRSGGSGDILPHLTSLTLTECRSTDGALAEMMRSRRSPNTRSRSKIMALDVNARGYGLHKDQRAVESLTQEGMNIRWVLGNVVARDCRRRRPLP